MLDRTGLIPGYMTISQVLRGGRRRAEVGGTSWMGLVKALHYSSMQHTLIATGLVNQL